MLRVVVVTSVMHAVVGFAQVPRNTAQESLETRSGSTGQCGAKNQVTRCLAMRVDAVEAGLQTQIEAIWRALGSSPDGAPVIGEHPADTCDYSKQVFDGEKCVLRVPSVDVEESPPQGAIFTSRNELKAAIDEWFDGAACVRRDAAGDMPEQEESPAESLPQGTVFNSRDELKAAIDAWINDKAAAEKAHGPIAGWDTSGVDDMSSLFEYRQYEYMYGYMYGYKSESAFNAAIGGWDTSSVTNMESTFNRAEAFNQKLDWDTSKVTMMQAMFNMAKAFDQDLSKWDVGRVIYFNDMFYLTGCEATNCGCSSCA